MLEEPTTPACARCSTQNVAQTGQLLQARRAHDIFLRQLAAILTTRTDLAERTKDVLLPGRTHGQHAMPARFNPASRSSAFIDRSPHASAVATATISS
jgi:hypothetical protein